MRPLLPPLAACALLLTGAPAARAEEKIDCANAQTTVEMNYCSEQDFEAADKDLNQQYDKALAYIAESNLEKPYDPKSWTEAMRAAQRAWVAYRDADCKDLMPMEWSGGTGTSSAVMGCMTEKTIARTKELKERYEEH
jgi:uncharacterized protein YecT (DUF1311 family)